MDWLDERVSNFNGMPTRSRLFSALRLENSVRCTFIYTLFCRFFAQLYNIKYSYLILLICTQLYGFKYSNQIQITWTQLYGFKYSYQIQITCTQLYSFKYSYLIQKKLAHSCIFQVILYYANNLVPVVWFKYSNQIQIICAQLYDFKFS